MAEKKLANNSLTEATAVITTNLRHERKMSVGLLLMLKKILYAGPKYFDKLKPDPGPTRKARLITLHHVKSFILRVLLA